MRQGTAAAQPKQKKTIQNCIPKSNFTFQARKENKISHKLAKTARFLRENVCVCVWTLRFFVCVIVASFDFGFVLRCLVVCGEARPLSPRKLPTLEPFRRKKTDSLRYGVRRSRSKFSSNQFILFRPFLGSVSFRRWIFVCSGRRHDRFEGHGRADADLWSRQCS